MIPFLLGWLLGFGIGLLAAYGIVLMEVRKLEGLTGYPRREQ